MSYGILSVRLWQLIQRELTTMPVLIWYNYQVLANSTLSQ